MIPSKEFVELDKLKHERKSFDCGQEALNTFLQAEAARHREAGISRTMVLPEESNAACICAYYTLTHTEIKRDALPDALSKKLPRYPLPVLLIAQLAVHQALQGQGLGNTTLICALKHALRINQHLPSYAVVVDVLNDATQGFYTQFGFQILYQAQNRIRLFLPMQTVAQLFLDEFGI